MTDFAPFLIVKKVLEPYICPHANTCIKSSSYRSEMSTVYVQLLKYNLTKLVLVSTESYSPSARPQCSLARLPPPFKKFFDPPLALMVPHRV